MSESEEILDLLEKCEELRRQGKSFEESIDLVCSLCPDLKEEVVRYLRKIEWAGQFFGLEHGEMAATGKEGHDTPLSPEVEPPPPDKVGRYQLDLLLGSGGFGRVWRAYDPKLQRRVAIKIARPGRLLSTSAMEAMLDEARKAASLVHPGIVAVHDADSDGPYCYIVSDLVEGANLAEHISQASFSFTESARLTGTVAEALHYAHGKGIVHLDIKPRNILLDAEGNPHVADFGLARQESAVRKEGHEYYMAGTPGYMSPEQALGQSHRAGASSDIYSLGIVLFELLTRERPFRGKPHMVLQQTIEDDPPRPRRLDATVPADLETICLKCLEKEPERRFRSAQELAEELARFRRGEPILARPISRAERAWRWCRRNPLPAGLLSAVAVLLVALTTGAIFWATRETTLRRLAEDKSARAQEAETQTRAALAKSSFQAGELASQRGKWQEALIHYDEALAAGFPDPILVRLQRLKALRAGAGPGAILQEIQLLLGQEDLGNHQGEVWLWQALELWSQNKDQDAIALIEKALKFGLPPAEAAWARSLIADTFEKAVVYNREALQANPFFHPAICDLCGKLFFLGRKNEARDLASLGNLLFPKDPNFSAILALCAALEGNRKEADLRLREACSQLDKQSAATMEAFVDLASEAGVYDFIDASPADEARLLMKITPLLNLGLERQEEILKNGPRPTDSSGRPLVIFLGGRQVREIKGLLRKVVEGKGFLETMGEVVKIYSEGTTRFLFGEFLFYANKLEEAKRVFLEAAELPALVPSVNRRAYLLAAISAYQSFESKGGIPKDLENSMTYMRRYLQVGMVSPCQDALRLVPRAETANHLDLASQLITEGLREKPDNLDLLTLRVRIDYKKSDYLSALKAADAILHQKPGDAKMQSLRKEILGKLEGWLAKERSVKSGK